MNDRKRKSNRITPEELDRIRKGLLERKRFLWNKVLQDLEREGMDEHREIVNTIRENGDMALEDLREDNVLRFIQIRTDELEEIEEALRRMESGEYGTCTDCGRVINPARLEVRPFATRCIECQERLERIENI